MSAESPILRPGPLSSDYSWRDRVACALCNFILTQLASPRYRAMIGGSIRYGLDAAARDEVDEYLAAVPSRGDTPPR